MWIPIAWRWRSRDKTVRDISSPKFNVALVIFAGTATTLIAPPP